MSFLDCQFKVLKKTISINNSDEMISLKIGNVIGIYIKKEKIHSKDAIKITIERIHGPEVSRYCINFQQAIKFHNDVNSCLNGESSNKKGFSLFDTKMI
jgi:hypothetical protein